MGEVSPLNALYAEYHPRGEEQQAQGIRVKPSYVERLAYVPATCEGDLRERVFGRAGPRASRDYEALYGGR